MTGIGAWMNAMNIEEKEILGHHEFHSNYEKNGHSNELDNDGRSCCFWKIINLFNLSATGDIIETAMYKCIRSYWKVNVQFSRDDDQNMVLGIIDTEGIKLNYRNLYI